MLAMKSPELAATQTFQTKHWKAHATSEMYELLHAEQSSEEQTQLSATMFDVFRQIIDQKDTKLKFFK